MDKEKASEFSSEPLTGNIFQFNFRDLAYLFLELKKSFEMNFTAEDVENYQFNNINNISKIIVQKTNLVYNN